MKDKTMYCSSGSGILNVLFSFFMMFVVLTFLPFKTSAQEIKEQIAYSTDSNLPFLNQSASIVNLVYGSTFSIDSDGDSASFSLTGDVYYDGVYLKDGSGELSSLYPLEELILDQFGNYYSFEQISVGIGAVNNARPPSSCSNPLFNLIFEDEINATGVGFDLDVNQKVACAVFLDIANNLVSKPNLCTGEQAKVNIVFKNSTAFFGDEIGVSSPYFHSLELLGLNSGLPWYIINTGFDPIAGGTMLIFILTSLILLVNFLQVYPEKV